MSMDAVCAVLYDERTRGAERLVMIVLAEHADPYLRCWPGINRIARMANLTVDHTKRTIRSLVEQGLIERHVNQAPIVPGQRADQRTNFYYLVMLEGQVRVHGDNGERGGLLPATGGTSARDGGENFPRNRGQKSPLTVIEPSLEPSEKNPSRGDTSKQTETDPVGTDGGTLFDRQPTKRADRKMKRNPVVDALFDEWWNTWPRKTAKANARTAWNVAATRPAPTIAEITTATANLLVSMKDYETRWGVPVDPKYVAHPSTFLRGGWENFHDGPNPDHWPGPNQVGWAVPDLGLTEAQKAAQERARKRAEAEERIRYQTEHGGGF